jgi:hypothetical protein
MVLPVIGTVLRYAGRDSYSQSAVFNVIAQSMFLDDLYIVCRVNIETVTLLQPGSSTPIEIGYAELRRLHVGRRTTGAAGWVWELYGSNLPTVENHETPEPADQQPQITNAPSLAGLNALSALSLPYPATLPTRGLSWFLYGVDAESRPEPRPPTGPFRYRPTGYDRANLPTVENHETPEPADVPADVPSDQQPQITDTPGLISSEIAEFYNTVLGLPHAATPPTQGPSWSDVAARVDAESHPAIPLGAGTGRYWVPYEYARPALPPAASGITWAPIDKKDEPENDKPTTPVEIPRRRRNFT